MIFSIDKRIPAIFIFKNERPYKSILSLFNKLKSYIYSDCLKSYPHLTLVIENTVIYVHVKINLHVGQHPTSKPLMSIISHAWKYYTASKSTVFLPCKIIKLDLIELLLWAL